MEVKMPYDRKLFVVTQWVLHAGIIVNTLLIGLLVLGAATIYGLSVPLDEIARGAWGVTMTADEIGRMALAEFATLIAALALVQFILRALRRVVASASVGDPFIEANAVDLLRVAWLLLSVNVIDALFNPMVYLLAPDSVRAKIHDTVDISITGLFAVLLIFVLAQIFRRGSDMRAELAGTI
jgi:hypothetical protein